MTSPIRRRERQQRSHRLQAGLLLASLAVASRAVGADAERDPDAATPDTPSVRDAQDAASARDAPNVHDAQATDATAAKPSDSSMVFGGAVRMGVAFGATDAWSATRDTSALEPLSADIAVGLPLGGGLRASGLFQLGAELNGLFSPRDSGPCAAANASCMGLVLGLGGLLQFTPAPSAEGFSPYFAGGMVLQARGQQLRIVERTWIEVVNRSPCEDDCTETITHEYGPPNRMRWLFGPAVLLDAGLGWATSGGGVQGVFFRYSAALAPWESRASLLGAGRGVAHGVSIGYVILSR